MTIPKLRESRDCEHLGTKCTYCFCLLEKWENPQGSSSGGKDFNPLAKRIRPYDSASYISLKSGVTTLQRVCAVNEAEH